MTDFEAYIITVIIPFLAYQGFKIMKGALYDKTVYTR
jgi:hypothetical protein